MGPITLTPAQTALALFIIFGIPAIAVGTLVGGIWAAVDHRLRPGRSRASTAAGVGVAAAVLPLLGLLGAYVVARHHAEYPDRYPTGGEVIPTTTTIPGGRLTEELDVGAVLVSPDGQDAYLHATHLPVPDGTRPCNVTYSTEEAAQTTLQVDVSAQAQTHGPPGSMGGCVWGAGTITLHLQDPLAGRNLIVLTVGGGSRAFRQQRDGAYARCAPGACQEWGEPYTPPGAAPQPVRGVDGGSDAPPTTGS